MASGNDAASLDDLQREVEGAELALRAQWQQLLQGGRPAPITWRAATRQAATDALEEADAEAAAAAATAGPLSSSSSSSSQPEQAFDPESGLLPTSFKDTWATKALLLVTGIVFVMQWAPLAGPLLQQLQSGRLDVLALVALACPDTAVCNSLHMFAMTSLEDVGEVLQMAEGPLLLMCIYFIAGATASLAQLLVTQQPAGIAGTGAVVGLYSALAVHSWKTGQGQALGRKDAVVLTAAAMFSAYQPSLGLWSFAGGAVGGAAAALVSRQLLVVLRVAVYLPLVCITCFLEIASQLPRLVVSTVMNTLVFLASGVVEVVKTVRGL
ncbi:MAG: hypothetical protein WDW38_008032 [Sanguina aurantia]